MSNGPDLFNQLIQNPFPSKQDQGLASAPSNALAQGNVLLKITCGDDIRCRSVSEDYGWQDLQYTIQQMFAQEISPRDPIRLRFRDGDGDWVTMATEDEYNLAKQLSPKLHICVSQQQQPPRTLDIPQFRKALVRLREEINNILECLPSQRASEDTPAPPPALPLDTKKQEKEAPLPDTSLVNSVLDVIEDSKPVRTVSPQQAPTLVSTEPLRQYSHLNLPASMMPNSGQAYSEFSVGTDLHVAPISRPAGISAPPSAPFSTQPSAPSTVPSASTLFHAQHIPFNVPQTPYTLPGYAPVPPQPHPVPYSSAYYNYPK